MSDHISYIKKVSQKPLKRLEQELSKTINNLNPHIQSIRVKKINNGPVNRVYVQTKDTGIFATVGWVVNDDIATCMSCPNTFGFFTWKHHCRACGNLVCYNCSNNQSLLLGAEQLGQQRICNECCSKQKGAKLAVPVRVYGSMDWGKPLGSQDTNSEASDDDESEPSTPSAPAGSPVRNLAESGKRGSMLQISSVDERTVSQANENGSQQHPALIGAILNNEEESKVDVAPAPVAGVMVPAYNSSQFITLAMVSFNNSELADRKQVRSLKATAATHPKILLGWQVTTEVHVKPECIFVVVDIRKNASRKTEFKLVNVNQKLETKVLWTLLKRSDAKQGQEFVPMRKVLWTGEQDISKGIKMVEDKDATPRA